MLTEWYDKMSLCNKEMQELVEIHHKELEFLETWAKRFDECRDHLEHWGKHRGSGLPPSIKEQGDIIKHLLDNVVMLTTKGGRVVHFQHCYT